MVEDNGGGEVPSLGPAATKALLGLAVLGLAGTLVFAAAWWLGLGGRGIGTGAAAGGVGDVDGLAALTPADRQALLEDLLAVSPGLYVPAWFEPAVGYTLEPSADHAAWGTEFRSNSLGYRAGPPDKAPGTLRVVFVGDSWTFGMGVDEAQAFPARLAALAREHSGADRPVEAFTLALPGYNLANQLAAVEFFRDRLEPDAVVFAPTPNDADSTGVVLPNGSLGRVGLAVDRFDPGSPSMDAVTAGQNLAFHTGGFVDSHLLRTRWRRSFERLADLDRRLDGVGVPVAVFFTGTWNRDHAHRLMIESDVAAPYALTPPELTGRRWRNPPPVRHPSPEAHALYARIVYRLLTGELGWEELPALDGEGEGAELADGETVHRLRDLSAAERARRLDSSHAAAARATERSVPAEFRPGSSTAAAQAVGPMDPVTGAFGTGTTVLVRRPAGAERLRATFEPVAAAPGFYPLTLEVEIPSPGGGVRRSVTLDPSGPAMAAVVELPLPADLPAGWALDIVVRAPRSRAEPNVLAGSSARLAALDLD